MFCTMPIIYNKSPASFIFNNKRLTENLNMYMYRSKSEKICSHTDHLIADQQVFFSCKQLNIKRQSYNQYVNKNKNKSSKYNI